MYGWDRRSISLQIYSFADLLKEHICIDILGLKREQCYGTDAEKDSPTKLRWEDMPVPRKIFDIVCKWYDEYNTEDISDNDKDLVVSFNRQTGFMSGRQVMQFVGTDIFRAMYPRVWCEGTIKKIRQDKADFAMITDCRFPDEVEVVQEAGGKVIRFLRNELNDPHHSETALDDYTGFDAVIDNSCMSLSTKNDAVLKQLKDWNYC